MSARDPDRLTPWLVLGLFISLTALATFYVWRSSGMAERAGFERASQTTSDTIAFRLDTYVDVLRATSGIFASDDFVTDEEFRAFAEHLDISGHYPGMRSIGFLQRVAPDQREALTRFRQLKQPGFHIWPESNGEAYVVVMIEPLDDLSRRVVGFDMYTRPERRLAMERARDTAAPAATSRVTKLIQYPRDNQAAFLIFVPVYRTKGVPQTVAERRELLMGFIFGGFRVGDLLAGMLQGSRNPEVDFELYDSNDLSYDRLVYSSLHETPEAPRFTRIKHIDIAGHPWTIRFLSRRAGWGSAPFLALATLISGVLISVLLFSLIRVQLRARRQAEETAEQLRTSEAQLQQASRAKDEFLATLSHELRTPMTAILGWSKLLAAEDLDPETASTAVDAIQKSGKAQAQLIDDLLDVSRITAGKMRIESKPVELAPVVDAALDAIAPAAMAKGVEVRREVGAAPIRVLGDAHRLQQIMWNLLSNAVKFTPRGGSVTLVLRRQEGDALIEVRDTGAGIDPQFIPHVFERFRQADSSTSRPHAGLGLGLAIVRHLAELHGGDVQAASEGVGKGSTFTLRLPLLKSTNQPLRDGTDPFITGEPLRDAKVLIVDDEETVREFVLAVFRRKLTDVRGAASADEAMLILDHWTPDVIISDLGMPGVDGYELLARIRKGRAGVPVIALTAYARPEDAERVMQAGFDAFVPKPVEPSTLLDAVRAAMPARSTSA